LGYYDPSGDLLYAGRVGTGFSAATLADVSSRLNKLIAPKSSFSDLSGRTGEARGVTWVKPKLVGQVSFSHWTEGGHLRHPVFLGLREDKPARQVKRDAAISIPEATTMKAMTKRRTASATETDNVVAGVTLSHPDKVLYPDDGVTKLNLAHYYEKVAEWMLPHIKNRLMSLVRCPEGSGTKCFFQKHPGEGPSGKLRRYPVEESNGVEEYLAVRDLAGLVTLVQMGVLEIHVWGSTADRYEKPDRLIFDLDPDPAVKWPAVVQAAREVRALLGEVGLVSFLKTTGGKGLHIVVPIERRLDWDDAKAFCRAVADFLVAAAPDRYIAKMSKAARKGKIFVDYLRNDRGATAIAPYSTRAKPGATVSVPIDWKELSSRLTSDHFTIANLPQRLARLKTDPWAEIGDVRQSVTTSMLKSLHSL
jgi:bifunctional non-homologous end joining protein LigD